MENNKEEGLSYTEIITGQRNNIPIEDQEAWEDYKRIYVDSNLEHTCDFDWYKNNIRPYVLNHKKN